MKKILLYITVIAMAVGCKKALDVEPKQSIDANTALTTRDGINAAIVSVYSKLKSARQYGRDLIALPEALSDNGYATNKSGRLQPEANNVFRAHFGDNPWQNSYFAINEINLILEAIPALDVAPAVSTAERNGWEGALLFLRALYHFDIVKAYAYMPGAVVAAQDKGGVPIMLKGVKTAGDAILTLPARAPIADVYNQIVADLEQANSKLPAALGNVIFANKPATQAMLSRVNLYRKDYTQAKRWADSAIATVGLRLAPTGIYVSEWRKATHVETLFQVGYTVNGENIGVNESLQTSFTTLVTPGNTAVTGGFGDLVPSISMLNDLGITLQGGNNRDTFLTRNAIIASRTADVRNQLYEVGTTGRGKSYVETTKFLGKNGFINLDNVPIIRVAELYLNRAEAMSTPGSPVFNESAALSDLNRVASNRGLPDFALTGVALYNEVIKQRRIELAFEGHRFWDLKRLGKDILKGPLYNDVAFTDIRILAPLPQREIDGNKNLVQNSGY
jgi:starch-binding outer membrane protein, SusD/RagB family